jgi:hypothetical protein
MLLASGVLKASGAGAVEHPSNVVTTTSLAAPPDRTHPL